MDHVASTGELEFFFMGRWLGDVQVVARWAFQAGILG